MENKNIIFVVGAAKTGTSVIVQMLNAHPDVFILYETRIGRHSLDKYGGRFISSYPDARNLFSYGAIPEDFFIRLQKFLAEKGYPFKVVGSDAPEFEMNACPMDILNPHPVIFTIRDIRTWLAKNSTITQYFTDNNVVCAAIDYTTFFIKSFLLDKVLRARMEDIISRNNDTIEALSSFLNLAMRPHLNEWWKVTFPDSHPKRAQKWRDGHFVSAHYGPRGNEDTEVTLAPHPFWDELLPIFDAYYNNPTAKIPKETIFADIERLQALKRFSPLKLDEVYKSYKHITLLPEGHLKRKARTEIIREIKRMKSMGGALMRELFRRG
ncbi:MAG: hypothetical protein HYY55_00075 [Candidatus Niyogibacteria bacterium]|nr:MAG: hypothetical protein HYY55_00075 [Candidatus Niyogibacteria bacterium]